MAQVGPGRPKNKYIAPTDDEDSFTLPDNKTILRDFKCCGGSFNAFLQKFCVNKDQQKILACDVLAQINEVREDREAWEQIRILAEQSEALLARDRIIELSKQKGGSQIQALKQVRDFTKDHIGKVREAIDQHLEEIEDDETEP